jgi:hypothetical protein
VFDPRIRTSFEVDSRGSLGEKILFIRGNLTSAHSATAEEVSLAELFQ